MDGLVSDIVERDTKDLEPPKPPGPPQKKANKPSRWKTRQMAEKKPEALKGTVASKAEPLNESEKIHIENLQRIASMSEEEVAKEREQLLGSMDPEVLRSLLKRARDGPMEGDDVDRALGNQSQQNVEQKVKGMTTDTKDANDIEQGNGGRQDSKAKELTDDDNNDEKEKEENEQKEEKKVEEPTVGVHFAKPKFEKLDPNDPDFVQKLHSIYYPDLAVEPDKLAWMTDATTDPDQYGDAGSLAPSELRFDFRGDLLSPRLAKSVAPHRGLHHHGDNPEAAGYTIGELVHLGRSTVPAQRSIACQTLGRILYKLGRGVYGPDISGGVQGVVEYSRVIDVLQMAANDRSVGVQAHAVEALWLWRGARKAN
uniref:ARAD1D01408p n=1 Tax=Blastobotrys adeninivorans TaxID=409370 RepID=A0A060TDM3_BLAAD